MVVRSSLFVFLSLNQSVRESTMVSLVDQRRISDAPPTRKAVNGGKNVSSVRCTCDDTLTL